MSRQARVRREKVEWVDVLLEMVRDDHGLLRQRSAGSMRLPHPSSWWRRRARPSRRRPPSTSVTFRTPSLTTRRTGGEVRPGPPDGVGTMAARHGAGSRSREAARPCGRDGRRRPDGGGRRRCLGEVLGAPSTSELPVAEVAACAQRCSTANAASPRYGARPPSSRHRAASAAAKQAVFARLPEGHHRRNTLYLRR